MSREGTLYCDSCLMLIGLQRHVAFKRPGSKGESAENYLHYHNRSPEDCWAQQVRQSMERHNEKPQ